MSQLDQIEKKYDFVYPKLYRKLYDDGMFNWGKFGPNWYATYWEKHKLDPPLLFFDPEYEPIELNQVIEEIETMKDPEDYRGIPSEYKLIPFAMTGGGDLYAFQFDKQCGENVPITLVHHDGGIPSLMAKNIQDFIFRRMIECVVDVKYSKKASDGDLKANIFNMLRTHKPYLTQHQAKKVEEIYSRNLFEYKNKVPSGYEYTITGLISMDESENVLRQELEIEGLDIGFAFLG